MMLDELVPLWLTGKDSCFSDCLGQCDLNPLCELKIGAASCDAGFVLCQWNGPFMAERARKETYGLSDYSRIHYNW